MLRIFTSVKIQRLRPCLNPRTWVSEASMLTTRPPKPSTLCKRRFESNHPSILCSFKLLLPFRIRDKNLIGTTHSLIFCWVCASALFFGGVGEGWVEGGLIDVNRTMKSF